MLVIGGSDLVSAPTSCRASRRFQASGVDIVRTTGVAPTLASATTLGVIVLVRVLLSSAIDIDVVARCPSARERPPTSRETSR